MVFYGTLWAAGSADLLATQFTVSFEGVIWTLRGVLVLGPPVAYLVTRRACVALQQSDLELAEHGAETGVIRRLPGGEYREDHRVEPTALLPVGERAAL